MPAPHPFWLQDWLQPTHILLVLRGSLPRPSGPCNSAPPPPPPHIWKPSQINHGFLCPSCCPGTEMVPDPSPILLPKAEPFGDTEGRPGNSVLLPGMGFRWLCRAEEPCCLLLTYPSITRLASISSPSTTHRATRSVPQAPTQHLQPRGELC